jgi:DNA modification methylase
MELQTNPHNPRTISKDAYEKLKKSIERNPDGLTANKIAYKDGIIISGNQRYRAIQELKLDMKPEWFKDLSGWTQEQIDEWVIQSNISAGEWDWDILANEWEADTLIDWGIDMPDDWGTSKELPEDIDEIPEVKTPVSKLGDLWLLGSHRVLCGDSTDKSTVERLMDGKKADMVFTDPPYGAGFDIKNDDSSFLEVFAGFYKVMPCDDNIYICCDFRCIGDFYNEIKKRHQIYNLIVWVKNLFGQGKLYHTKHEEIIFCGDGKFDNSKSNQDENVWNADSVRNFGGSKNANEAVGHPTQKPVEICARAINNSSKTGHIVYDGFLGSGSTLIACEQTNRTCYGLELDPHYIDVICKRWQTLTGQMPILESTGEAHDFMVQ